MRFDELNWMDVEEYLKQDDRLIFVLGATEQHGYLSLTTDTKIPLALADAASAQTGVLVAPPFPYGISPYFGAYPGTLSLRLTVYVEMIADLVRSVYGYGFRRLLFINGHGGNDPARGRLNELVNELPGLRAAFYSWWNSHSVTAVAQKYDLKSYHAGWIEAYPFTRVTDLPEEPKLPVSYQGQPDAKRIREIFGDGVCGGPYQVDPAINQEVFTAALEDILHLLLFQ